MMEALAQPANVVTFNGRLLWGDYSFITSVILDTGRVPLRFQ
jgi:hypothetical protein